MFSLQTLLIPSTLTSGLKKNPPIAHTCTDACRWENTHTRAYRMHLVHTRIKLHLDICLSVYLDSIELCRWNCISTLTLCFLSHTLSKTLFLCVFRHVSSLQLCVYNILILCVCLQTGSSGEHPSGGKIQLVCQSSIHLSDVAESLVRGAEQSGYCLVLLDPH